MPKKSKANASGSSFAEQYAELEKIVAEFEHEGMNLDDGLEKFERGLQIAGSLRKTLNAVENNIEKLKKQYDVDGNTDRESRAD